MKTIFVKVAEKSLKMKIVPNEHFKAEHLVPKMTQLIQMKRAVIK